MSAAYAFEQCSDALSLSKNSDDFNAIKKLKLSIPTRADWQAAKAAGELTEQMMINMDHATVGFILGVACDASSEDIKEAAQLLIQQEARFTRYMNEDMDLKFKLWVYTTNIKLLTDIVKQYF